jgi:peptidoglycan/xylan/chitin deacetylase (PgdA/CDA1 family)
MLADPLLRMLAGVASPAGPRARLSILIYHRVVAQEDPLTRWDLTAERFSAQMALLAAQYTPMALGEAIARLEHGALPARTVCVTFDDGYADNAEVALPILQRHAVPATFFVATGFLDGGRMWNDTVIEAIRGHPGEAIDLGAWGLGALPLTTPELRRAAIPVIITALKHLPAPERQRKVEHLAALAATPLRSDLMMRSDQVLELRRAGMDIGAHTLTHPILTRIPEADARREINESRGRLEALLREPVSLFAYPNGKPGQDYTAEHVRMVREAGFSAAVSTAWGAASAHSDRFQLPRFTPWDRRTWRFSLRLMGNCRSAREVAA